MTLLDEASRRLDHIRPRRTGYYVPDPAGVLAVIVPVFGTDDELIDLCAYRPEAPGIWWLRTGLGTVLGEDVLERCQCYADPVATVATPREWTRAQAYRALNTVCLLDRARGKAALAGVEIARQEVRRAA